MSSLWLRRRPPQCAEPREPLTALGAHPPASLLVRHALLSRSLLSCRSRRWRDACVLSPGPVFSSLTSAASLVRSPPHSTPAPGSDFSACCRFPGSVRPPQLVTAAGLPVRHERDDQPYLIYLHIISLVAPQTAAGNAGPCPLACLVRWAAGGGGGELEAVLQFPGPKRFAEIRIETADLGDETAAALMRPQPLCALPVDAALASHCTHAAAVQLVEARCPLPAATAPDAGPHQVRQPPCFPLHHMTACATVQLRFAIASTAAATGAHNPTPSPDDNRSCVFDPRRALNTCVHSPGALRLSRPLGWPISLTTPTSSPWMLPTTFTPRSRPGSAQAAMSPTQNHLKHPHHQPEKRCKEELARRSSSQRRRTARVRSCTTCFSTAPRWRSCSSLPCVRSQTTSAHT